MLFSRQSDILLILTECTTRITIMQRLQSKRADETADAIPSSLKALLEAIRKIITFGSGGEFARQIRYTNSFDVLPPLQSGVAYAASSALYDLHTGARQEKTSPFQTLLTAALPAGPTDVEIAPTLNAFYWHSVLSYHQQIERYFRH